MRSSGAGAEESLKLSWPPPRPPPGPLPGASRRRICGRRPLGGSATGAPAPVREGFSSSPSPQRGNPSGRQTKVPVAAAGGGGAGASASAPLDAPCVSPSLPRACWFWGGAGKGTPDALGSALASDEGAGESGVWEGAAALASSS